MCRIIKPYEGFYMPPTAESNLPPYSLLCPIYSNKTAEVDLRPSAKAALPLRTGLEFVLGPEGVQFVDLAFVEEIKARVAELMSTASSSDILSNNTHLAKKTLKFRNIA